MDHKKKKASHSLKTKFFNILRLPLRLPFLEKTLVELNRKTNSWFIQKLVPPNYLYPRNSIRNIERNDIKYNLDISNVVDHFIYFGFQENTYHSLLEEIKNAKVILDIGANIGTSFLYFASISNAKILAFEPDLENYEKALKNLAINSLQTVDLVNIGLGDKKQKMKLVDVNTNNPGMKRISKAETDNFKWVEIHLLDEILFEKNINSIDFVKIDVEGFEWHVIKGGELSLKKYLPTIVVEVDENNLNQNDKSAAELIERLIELGYTTFKRAENMAKVDPNDSFKNCHFDMIVKA